MIATQDPVLEQIIRLIVARIDPQKIILFGSRARGDARPDSDIDLLIVEDNDRQDATRRLGDLYVAMVHVARAVPVDLLLYSQGQFERWRSSHCNVIGRAHLEGQVVYERS
jgi:predicted nucleotidyltransferase